ncbi:unnamed protein product [Rotaria sp. Silwood2]|nr:unnamed protein product [Rotaria sp. Silwood2]CAF2689603.1 unnamed protein product [Rotaria sp. Silwood2]CAF3106315.1 unnamed protein product [Rotaria sp. Silwood2]CAF3892573.1 unnamed protein product [Rotaria sp. Silwood2]CAF3993667.1 unnamed protein product [Rotaria sp. Silwood2]
MSLKNLSTNNTHEDYLSSNDKVIHYLQNSTGSSTKTNSLSMLRRSPSSNLYLLQNRLRYCSENDSISSSSSSVMDSLSRSDFSLESSLSDPIAHCSIFNSNISSEEEIDFNIGFDQISDDDDDDDDYDDNDDYNKKIFNKKQLDTVALFNKSSEDINIKKLEDFIYRSSNSTIFNGDCEINNNDIITLSPIKQQQQQNNLLHDSTFTLCSQDPFSAYTEDHDNNQENEAISGFSIRSNSLSALQTDKKSTLVEKAPKKAVRFADTLGLDLESIRYMSPPDQLSTPVMQECLRLQLGQLRLGKNMYKYPTSSSSSSLVLPTKTFYLVSKQFTSPTNIIPLIYEKKVMLECLYTKESIAYGTVRVHNCTYDKLVFIRVTQNEWETYKDIQASHSMNFPVDNTDIFTFQITLSKSNDDTTEPKRILFAICLQTMSQTFWDNNQGWNYVLDVFEK